MLPLGKISSSIHVCNCSLPLYLILVMNTDHSGSTLLGIWYDHKSYFTSTLDQPKLRVSLKAFSSAFRTESFLRLKLHEGKTEKEFNK